MKKEVPFELRKYMFPIRVLFKGGDVWPNVVHQDFPLFRASAVNNNISSPCILHKQRALFGFSIGGLKQNVKSLLTPVQFLNQFFTLFHVGALVLLSMVAFSIAFLIG